MTPALGRSLSAMVKERAAQAPALPFSDGFSNSGPSRAVFESPGSEVAYLVLSRFAFLACTHAVYRRLACGVHAAAPVNGVRAER